MEQDFASFVDMPMSWSNMATDLLLEPQNGPVDSSSQLGPSTVITGDSGGLSSTGVFSEDAALGYFNDWDDIEMYVWSLSSQYCIC